MPAWLKGMVLDVPVRYDGAMTLPEAKAAHVARHAAQEHGLQRMSWLELALDGKVNGEQFCKSLDELVKEKCPEQYNKVKNYLDGSLWLSRFGMPSLKAIEAFQERHRCPIPPFQMEWARDSKLLNEGKKRHKGQEHCDEEDQLLAVRRLLGAVIKGMSDQGARLNDAAQLSALLKSKAFAQDVRSRYIQITKKVPERYQIGWEEYGS